MKYPYYGKCREEECEGLIVLFTEPRTGKVIKSGESIWTRGLTSILWGESGFEEIGHKEMRDFEIIECMKTRGGSFVKNLGNAASHADSINLNKIKTTWPEYWEKYEKMAEGA